jgi:hypothetical protein
VQAGPRIQATARLDKSGLSNGVWPPRRICDLLLLAPKLYQRGLSAEQHALRLRTAESNRATIGVKPDARSSRKFRPAPSV